MDEHSLQLFPFPGRDAVFEVLQHALLWTYRDISLASCGAGAGVRVRPAEPSTRAAVCHVTTQSRMCLATGTRHGANLSEVLRTEHTASANMTTCRDRASLVPTTTFAPLLTACAHCGGLLTGVPSDQIAIAHRDGPGASGKVRPTLQNSAEHMNAAAPEPRPEALLGDRD